MTRDEAVDMVSDLTETVRAALRLNISTEEAAERILDSVDCRTDDPVEIMARVRDAARALS